LTNFRNRSRRFGALTWINGKPRGISPLHVILSVEAAFASAIGAKASEKMQANVKHRDIATTVQTVAKDSCDSNQTNLMAAMG
jgi:hypothetical protein